MKWLRLAAEQGDGRAMIFLYFMSQDDVEKAEWLRRADEQGIVFLPKMFKSLGTGTFYIRGGPFGQ